MFGGKYYKLSQTQIDEMNETFNAMKIRAMQTEQEVAVLKERLRISRVNDLLEEIESLKDDKRKLTKELTIAKSTMSAVLGTLNTTMRNVESLREVNDLYKEMNDYSLPKVTSRQLDILN